MGLDGGGAGLDGGGMGSGQDLIGVGHALGVGQVLLDWLVPQESRYWWWLALGSWGQAQGGVQFAEDVDSRELAREL